MINAIVFNKDSKNIPLPAMAEIDNSVFLSIVVPCFNEEAVITELHSRVRAVGDAVAPGRYELILINDGSTDRTIEIIKEMAEENSAIVGLDLARNYGHQIALTAGLSFARGQRILVIDADLQDPPELLPEMMKVMDRGANVVYGRRIERDGESLFKTTTAKSFYRLLDRMTDISIPLDTGDFRLLDRKALTIFLSMPEPYRFVRGMFAWAGLRQEEFPYRRQARVAGVTKYPLHKMIRIALDAITGFSVQPLRFSFYVALGFAALAFVLTVYVVLGWLFFATIQGWASILLTFLAFSSVQLFCLSIMGEYIGRTYMQTKNRPLFIVNEIYTTSREQKNN
jgi:glycosyltransferase involved in cell wall biosynthesis